jgi:hypothetical protein
MYWSAKLKIFGLEPNKIYPIRPYFIGFPKGHLNNAACLLWFSKT